MPYILCALPNLVHNSVANKSHMSNELRVTSILLKWKVSLNGTIHDNIHPLDALKIQNTDSNKYMMKMKKRLK